MRAGLFQFEANGDDGLRFDWYSAERGGTVAPLANRGGRRVHGARFAFDKLEIVGVPVLAGGGVEGVFALTLGVKGEAGRGGRAAWRERGGWQGCRSSAGGGGGGRNDPRQRGAAGGRGVTQGAD